MPHLFRTPDGTVWRPGAPVSLTLADGAPVEGIWAGSATAEKLAWWLRPAAGSHLAQTPEIAAVASKADDTGEIIWGDAPAGGRLLFVVQAVGAGKNYRLAKMVTTAATPPQIAYFRHERSALFGRLNADGGIREIPPLDPPLPILPAQPELF